MPTVEINLSEDLLRRLDERMSQARGTDRAEYIRRLVERDVEESSTLDEILAPFREQVRTSGVTDEELTSLFEEAREEAWQERQARTQRGG